MEYVFTEHVNYRIGKRNLMTFEVIDVIKNSDVTLKYKRKFHARKFIGRGTVEVVYTIEEKYINIITVYWL